jgi:hypothetical protein
MRKGFTTVLLLDCGGIMTESTVNPPIGFDLADNKNDSRPEWIGYCFDKKQDR